MWKGLSVVVIVPAFDEAERVGRVVAGLPSWVDHVVVVDDGSRDGTAEAAERAPGGRITVVRHGTNRGVGASIATGYREAFGAGADVAVVMAGDAQMDPVDLPAVVGPIASGAAYVKGNRFVHPDRRCMPLARRIAGRILAALTRAATGLDVHDSQCGYTALSAKGAASLPLTELWPGYGYPNDLLGLLAAERLVVREVPVRPVYAGERSGIRPWHALVVAFVILRRWLKARARTETGALLTMKSRAR